MSTIHGGRLVAKALKAEDVPYVFTLCGGHVMSIYDGCLDEGIRVIDVRHEQTAAHAADGWARVTGQPGVAIVTAGPGLTDAVTGVANAHRAQHPDDHHRRAGAACLRRHGLAPGHEPRRADAADHQVGGARCRERRRLGEYVATAFRVATTERAGAGVPRDAARPPLRQVDESEAVFPTQYRTEAGIAGDPRYSSGPSSSSQTRERPVASSAASSLVAAARGLPEVRRDVRHAGLRERPGARQPAAGQSALVLADAQGRAQAGRRRAHLRHAARLPHRLRARIAHQPGREAHPGRPRRPRARPEPRLRRRHHRRHRPRHGAAHRAAPRRKASRRLSRSRGSTSCAQREDDKWEKLRPELTPTRPAQPAARLRRDRLDRSTTTRSSSATAATSSAPRPTRAALRAAGPLARPRPARHARRRPRLRDGGQARAAEEQRRHHLRRRRVRPQRDGVRGHGSARRSTSSASSATTRRGRRSCAARCSSTAPDRAAGDRSSRFTRYDQVVEALGGHGEWVERAEDIRPALERALGAGKPALVNVKIGRSDFRKDAISV